MASPTPDYLNHPLHSRALADQVGELVRSASQLSLRWFRQTMSVENKVEQASGAGFDPVTAADRAVEDALRAGLSELFPDDAILGEERGESGDGPYRWVIDPIDGTRAFITGQPTWGTLVGLEYNEQPIAGWMYQPSIDELYFAAGSGAYFQAREGSRQRLRTRTTTSLADAMLYSTHPSMFTPGSEADRFAQLEAATKMARYGGDCFNYGALAAGWIDLVVENQLQRYDISPLIPVLEQAGAVVSDLAGKSAAAGGYVVAAATPELHEAVLVVLNG